MHGTCGKSLRLKGRKRDPKGADIEAIPLRELAEGLRGLADS
jgi:hypothetical protein